MRAYWQPLAIVIAAFLALPHAAHAAEFGGRAHCYTTGPAALVEPTGPGRGIQAGTYACRMEGGPYDGAIVTGSNIYEVTAGAGMELLTGSSIARAVGWRAVFQVTQGLLKFEMRDGAVAGFNMSGRGVVKLASGTAAATTGRSYSFTARSTGVGQFVVENTFD